MKVSRLVVGLFFIFLGYSTNNFQFVNVNMMSVILCILGVFIIFYSSRGNNDSTTGDGDIGHSSSYSSDSGGDDGGD
ncbi:hypothetical protein [Neptunomonas japonica]|uniref:hypothetical protein n=1 Tax=Neptunomonas japonica TaxID=417574 RepID=UPI001916A685|nr:hypothetical protein [Neptunomonas japonica]